MQQQGNSPVNQQYFTSLTAQINNLNDASACAEIQKIVNQAAASIQAELASVKAQIDALLPFTKIPTDLGSVISWITNLATPSIKAYATYTAQLSSILSSASALESAIANAASRLTSCSINIPPMT